MVSHGRGRRLSRGLVVRVVVAVEVDIAQDLVTADVQQRGYVRCVSIPV